MSLATLARRPVLCALASSLFAPAVLHADLVRLAPSSDGGVAGVMEPPPCASVSLAQSIWDAPGFVGVGCNIFSADGSGDVGLARAFVMPVDAGFAVHCVNVTIATNSDPFTFDVNLWLGTPGTPMAELTLLATRTVEIPEINFADTERSVDFTDAMELPVVPAGATVLVEVFVPSRDLTTGGPGGVTTIGANDSPADGPTYVRSGACEVPDFVDLVQFLPNLQVVMRVDGEWVPPSACPADLDDDGAVDGADLGILLGGWGGAGSTDLNGDGTTDGADLGILLGAWGSC